MGQLFACPFCRQLFAKGEATVCPDCDIEVRPLDELPPSDEAKALDHHEPAPAPEDETLSWLYTRRGRGALTLLAATGIGLFFAPWLHEQAPEIRTWSGFEFARRLVWLWGAGIGWSIMLPLVASRRSIRQMRGARVAVGFLAAVVLTTVTARLVFVPRPHPLIVHRYAWGWGMYATGMLALAALVLAFRFGGTIEDLPTRQGRRGDETLH